MKLETLFPVQKQVIPIILNTDRSQSIYPNDICVTAPTGSGKTLTYVLPIIQSLRKRITPCCRAIVLLPVSDLAEQVYTIFKSQLETDEASHLIKNLGHNNSSPENNDLKVMLLSTKKPFEKEQAQLIDQQHSKCLIDIIVTTPGRLVDHIQKTKGFIFIIRNKMVLVSFHF
jgi:ATP-dependent RNA helicase DDX51/DBP6